MHYDEIEKQNIVKIRQLVSELPSFCKDYFRNIENNTASKTRIAYAGDLHLFFNFLYKYNPSINKDNVSYETLNSLTFTDIDEYLDYLKFYNNDDKIEVSNTSISINRKLASLKSFFNYLFNHDFIDNNPTAKVKLSKPKDIVITRLDNDEVSELLDSVETGVNLNKHQSAYHEKNKTRDLAILYLMLGTGIRVSECVNINIEDINYKDNAIKIKRKGGKEALIYFSDEVKEYLLSYHEERKLIIPADDDDKAFFLSSQNKRINVRTIQLMVKKYTKSVTPLKKITPHKLRSTYGTNLYRETGDIYLVANNLGHNDINTTEKHYAAMDEDNRKAARNILKLRSNKKPEKNMNAKNKNSDN